MNTYNERELLAIEELIKPYIKHSQGCSLNTAMGDMGDFCTCKRKFRREAIVQIFNNTILSQKAINYALKSVQFKDFVPVNGVRGDRTNEKCTLHNNARKRLAKAVVKAREEKFRI